MSELAPAIDTIIVPRSRDLGGLTVARVLPSSARRMVGPFIFLDRMGPVEFRPGQGLDVRPHPHIGLATVTYLFTGEIFHRDSIGSEQAIRPGDVNWMSAGRGIAHSERTAPDVRHAGHDLFGLQMWVALPRSDEESAPAFAHHDRHDLPIVEEDGARVRVVAGSFHGERSPVATRWDTLLADAELDAGGRLHVSAHYDERAIFVATGSVEIDHQAIEAGPLLVLRPGAAVTLRALTPARVTLLGGEPMDGPRHIWWNFVSSSKERIEQAKADWAAGRFDRVIGDAVEFVPLPD